MVRTYTWVTMLGSVQVWARTGRSSQVSDIRTHLDYKYEVIVYSFKR